MRYVYYPLATIACVLVVMLSSEAERLIAAAAQHRDLEGSADLAWKSLLETLSFSFYSGASDTREATSALLDEALRRQAIANAISVVLVIVTGLFLGRSRVFRDRRPPGLRNAAIAADTLAVSLLCLLVGIVAPILSLRAYAEVPVLGTVVLQHEVKSIITTIGSLANSGNFFIALLIAAFSVVTPLVKTIASVAVLQRKFPRWRNRSIGFIKAIGKWSMTDVFVVAILVAFFAARSDDYSDARVAIGLYYFSAYCLLSLVAGHFVFNSAASIDPPRTESG